MARIRRRAIRCQSQGCGRAEGRVCVPPVRMPAWTLLCGQVRKALPLRPAEPQEKQYDKRTCVLLFIPRYHASEEKGERNPKSLNICLRETKLPPKISSYRKYIDLPFMGSFSSIHRRMGPQPWDEKNYRKLKKTTYFWDANSFRCSISLTACHRPVTITFRHYTAPGWFFFFLEKFKC